MWCVNQFQKQTNTDDENLTQSLLCDNQDNFIDDGCMIISFEQEEHVEKVA